jgi:hypothetical protein
MAYKLEVEKEGDMSNLGYTVRLKNEGRDKTTSARKFPQSGLCGASQIFDKRVISESAIQKNSG